MATRYTAGMLRHRVEIQERTESRDDYGATVSTWGTVATCWAMVDQREGGEAQVAGQPRTNQQWLVVVRHRSTIAITARVKYSGRYLNIQSARDPFGDHEWLELICTEDPG